MKILSLYIDKWYIVGAVNTDGSTRLLNLPNREDRIWLYFHEDVSDTSESVSYSKAFQQNFRNKESHYFGDIFALIISPTATFTGFCRPQEMINIFASANIFNDIRNDLDVDTNERVETYVSFSQDIDLVARIKFLDVLAAQNFDVKESVARIEHLALEHASKKAQVSANGNYLVLNACNENLHFSIYQKSEDLYVRKNEAVLKGLGTDVRSRALVEQIVDNINSHEHLLKTEDEREFECLRLTQFVDAWLEKLASARGPIPVPIPGVSFSIDPHRDFPVSVQRAKVDLRTNRIVEDIVRTIADFVKNSGVSHEELNDIIYLGNTFTNNQFSLEFKKYYNLADGNVLLYKDCDLSQLVNTYTQIDCTQFDEANSKMRSSAEAEEQRRKNAREEEEARRKAQEEADAIANSERERTEAERKFCEAMQHGYESEEKRDFDDMADYFQLALNYRPDDEEANNKYQEALRKMAETKVLTDNYKRSVQLAKKAIDEEDWETAKQKAEEALGFMPESAEASRIKENAVRRLKQGKDFERYLDRADIFIAKKLYGEALDELSKAKLLELNNKESAQIKERECRIASEKADIEQTLNDLTGKLTSAEADNRFDEAIALCSELAETDYTNARKWNARIAELEHRKDEKKRAEENLRKLLRDIDVAQINEDWFKLQELCRQALEVSPNESVGDKLKQAQEKMREMESLKELDNMIAAIKDLILDGEFSSAKNKLSVLRGMALNGEYNSKVKELNKLIFEKEDDWEKLQMMKMSIGQQSTSVPPVDKTEVGGSSGISSSVSFVDDSGESSQGNPASPEKEKNPPKKNGGLITNDDFNF